MRKILIIFFIVVIIFCTEVWAKYKLECEIQCFEILIDNEPPGFEVKYSTLNWTNEDVIVNVIPSEEVEEIEGFEYTNGIYQKVVKQNEDIEIAVKDMFGNEGILKYSVKNIDKNLPYISDIEDGGKYYEKKEVEFIDEDSGIQKIDKIFYGDLLIDSNIIPNTSQISINVIREPKNLLSYKYYRIEGNKENYITSNLKNIYLNFDKKSSCKYYVIGTDKAGISYKSNVIENKENFLSQYHNNEEENVFSKSGWYDIVIYDNAGNISKYTIYFEI